MATSRKGSAAPLDDIVYKRNHLCNVIARLDLVTPIQEVGQRLPDAVRSAALTHYPAEDPRQAVLQQVVLGLTSAPGPSEAFVEWHFHGPSREKEFVIIPSAVFVEWTRYERYESLRSEFMSVVEAFLEAYPAAQIGRIGLRYVNVIELGQGAPLDWTPYIERGLLGVLRYAARQPGASRVVHHIEWVRDGLSLALRFGVPNPDYPAPARRRSFFLDYDAYHQGLLESSDIGDQLDRHHAAIQGLFEANITDALREEMSQ